MGLDGGQHSFPHVVLFPTLIIRISTGIGMSTRQGSTASQSCQLVRANTSDKTESTATGKPPRSWRLLETCVNDSYSL